MLIQEIIKLKRENQQLSKGHIEKYINGVTDNSVSEGQIAAMCMAIYFNKLNIEERTNLTVAMRDSGKVLSWQDMNLNGPVVDKHSTGGVGDVVSLMLAPMLAACGAYVPMISGRGLGHTGGTLDKMSSIPGFDTMPAPEKLRKIVKEVGAVIIGQTHELAPSDKRIYATRDITATVESIDLITASILSKKLAEGLDSLVMDIKVGNGAFMPTYNDSVELGKSIVSVAKLAGCQTTALLTDMNQVLARSAGNVVEVREAIRYLKGDIVSTRLHAVNMALCEQLLISGKLATNKADAHKKLQAVIDNGKALECFSKMVSAQGGPHDFVEKHDYYLTGALVIKPVMSPTTGVISNIDTRAIGLAVIGLGGGRKIATDAIDVSVGFDDIMSLGEKVDTHTPLAVIHAKNEDDWKIAADNFLNAVEIGEHYSPTKDVYELIQ